MGNIRIGKGKASIELDDVLHRHVDRVLRQVAPATVDQIQRTAAEVTEAARSSWPVKTGESRDGLTSGIRLVSMDSIEGFITNRVPYTYYIRPKSGGHAWRDLVVKPGKAAGERLAARLGSDIVRIAGSR